MIRKDLPPVSSPNFLEKVREALSVYLGHRGDDLDRGITVRDLADAVAAGGVVNTAISTAVAGVSSGGTTVINTVVANEPDLTPPPMPTGFAVAASIVNLIVTCDAQGYTVGHGHYKSVLYGKTYTSGALPVFANALVLTEFAGNVFSYATNPATTWRLWLKWMSVDGVLSSNPAGGTNGVAVTTGQDVALLLTALSGQIRATELEAALGTRIDLVDGNGVGSVNARVGDEAIARATAITNEATARGAAITTETNARQAADSSLSSSITTLTASVATNAAAISTEQTARANADSAIVNTATTLAARVTTAEGGITANAAAITTEATARANADSAIVSTATTLAARVTTAEGGITANAAALTTEASARASADSAIVSTATTLAARVTTAESGITANAAAITTEASARANADSAIVSTATTLAARVTTAEGGITTNAAAITTEASARASADSAITSNVTTLSSAVGTNTAAIQTEATTRASETAGLYAQYTIKLDVGGKVSGFGLASTNTASAFAIRADRFYISPPATGGGAATEIIPFIVQASATTINGVNVPAGVYMDTAFIRDGTITNVKIGNAAIDDAKITALSASKLTAGAVSVGQDISSSNYVAGSAGWMISGTGGAEFSGVTVRGNVQATSGSIGGNTIDSSAIRAGQSSFNTGTGFYLGSNGTFSLGQGGVKGMTWDGSNINIASPGFTLINGVAKLSGELNIGAFIGYNWPGTNGSPIGTGAHIGPGGFLIGNYMGVDGGGPGRVGIPDGKYFQIALGNTLGSEAAIYTNIPAYLADLQVTTLKINNNAITYSYTGSSYEITVNVHPPSTLMIIGKAVVVGNTNMGIELYGFAGPANNWPGPNAPAILLDTTIAGGGGNYVGISCTVAGVWTAPVGSTSFTFKMWGIGYPEVITNYRFTILEVQK